MQIEVIKKSLTYAGRTYAVGATFDMVATHAALFILLRNVRKVEEPLKPKGPSGRYRRRDMSAEA